MKIGPFTISRSKNAIKITKPSGVSSNIRQGIRLLDAAEPQKFAFERVAEDFHIDQLLESRLRTVRARAKDAEANNSIHRRWLSLLNQNVVGPKGVGYQSRVIDRYENGKPVFDRQANDILEKNWKDFCRAENFSINGMSCVDGQRVVMRRTPNDGEFFIHHRYSSKFKYGYKPHLIEASALDYEYNDSNANIVHGVKYDEFRNPLVYYFKVRQPGSTLYGAQNTGRKPIPASEITPILKAEYSEKSRGYPWCAANLIELDTLKEYNKESMIAARNAARITGFLEKEDGAFDPSAGGRGMTDTDDGGDGEQDSPSDLNSGDWEVDLPKGGFLGLPKGWRGNFLDPKHPTAQYEPFVTKKEKHIAVGYNLSYILLFADVSDVNFSSGRIGLLEDRRYFMELQEFLIEKFLLPIFERWLDAALMKGAILGPQGKPFPYEKYEKFNAPTFHGVRWDFIDPQKEVYAAVMAKDNLIKSLKRIHNDLGIEDSTAELEQISAEKETMQTLGLTFVAPAQPQIDDTQEDNDGQ